LADFARAAAARDVLSRWSCAPESFCPARSIIEPRASALRDVARLFLKLGLVGFGGPAAHILPGPNSTER